MNKKSSDLKVKARFVLFSDYALISQDGKLSIIGEFDQLFSSEKTATLTRGFLVSKVEGEPFSDVVLKVSLINDKSKKVLMNNSFTVKADGSGNAGILIEISGMGFPDFGLYKAQIISEEKVLGEAGLMVTRVEKPKAVQA